MDSDKSPSHLHVPYDPAFFTARQSRRPRSPHNVEEGEDLTERFLFPSPSRRPSLRDIDRINGIRRSPSPPPLRLTTESTMPTVEEQLQQLREIAEAQQKQLAEQQQQMEKAKEFMDGQTLQLQESKRQLEASQQNVADLTSAFRDLSAQQRPPTISSAPKKKPELPPFDSKNVLVWIRRIEAAFSRVGCVEPKDKFAWMESIFQVKLDPQIDAFLYNSDNTVENWNDFLDYLRQQYGPTLRQKAQKLLGEIPRHDLKPSQYLLQLKDDVKDVTIDHILKEHLLKTIPPRIREIMGKEVEDMSVEEVAKQADTFFDRHGKPTEKIHSTVSHITAAPNGSSASSTTSTPSSSAFTPLFSDEDDTDVNQVGRGGFRGNNRGRSRPRGQRSQSRPGFNRFNNASSSSGNNNNSNNNNNADSKSTFPPGTCRWHRRFGDKSLKCHPDCPRFKQHQASQQSGNGQGGRRM